MRRTHERGIRDRDKRRLRAGVEDAIRTGINRATRTLRNVEGAWVKDMNVMIDNGRITGYKVNLTVTFVMEDAAAGESTTPGTEVGPEDAAGQPTGA